MDSRARRNLNQVNTELQDVQRIMVQNIEDVLQRGEQLSGILTCIQVSLFQSSVVGHVCTCVIQWSVYLCISCLAALDDKASSLATMSQKYKKDAHYLNLRSSFAKISAVVIIIVVIFLFLWYWIFWNCRLSETNPALFVCVTVGRNELNEFPNTKNVFSLELLGWLASRISWTTGLHLMEGLCCVAVFATFCVI